MPNENINIRASFVIILSNLQLGGSQQSGRTDNVVAAKMRKLRWALDQARRGGGAVVLSGRVFNKANSFSDLSFLLNQGVLSSPDLYFIPDYPSYRYKGELSYRSMLGVVNNILPGKVIVEGATITSDSSSDVMYLCQADHYNPESVTEDHTKEQHYVFEYQRKIKPRYSDTLRRVYLSSFPKSASISDNEIHLGSVFRDTPSSDMVPRAVKLSGGCDPQFMEIPHETHVFDETIERHDLKRSQVKEQALLSISDEFDPRHKKVSEAGGFMNALNTLYDKNKITQPACDIIKKIMEQK